MSVTMRSSLIIATVGLMTMWHYLHAVYHVLSTDKVRPEAAYLYDAVWIYARAAHEVLEAGLDLSNGTLVMNYITNKKYRS